MNNYTNENGNFENNFQTNNKNENSNFNKKGYFYPATILDCRGVDTDKIDIFKTEVFGSVVPFYSFNDTQAVVNQANSIVEGLAAYIGTDKIDKAIQISEQLHFGMVGVNEGVISWPEIPFGGVKESGVGREGARAGMEEYMNIKFVVIGGQ